MMDPTHLEVLPAAPANRTNLEALRRAQYDEHVQAHLPDATGDPYQGESAKISRLRRENLTLRNKLEEFRNQPHTDAAFQQAVEEEFVGRRLDQELHPVPRETGSQIALAEALIVLAQSGGMDAASAHTAARLISDMIRY